MSGLLRRQAVRLRYALPGLVEGLVDGPDAQAAGRLCAGLDQRGMLATAGYFQRGNGGPDEVLAANLAVIEQLRGAPRAYLSLKAPPLEFDRGRIGALVAAAQEAGIGVVLDAHGPALAKPTLDLVDVFPGLGCALPARWRRSLGDAERLRDGAARVRVVKGEWADPDGDEGDLEGRYLAVIGALAGREAPVGVATHDPLLAERALAVLLAAGTPCELEQLRGLPRRRTVAVARRLGVPVRVYVPFGPGWWAYATDKALGRPYMMRWFWEDLAG